MWTDILPLDDASRAELAALPQTHVSQGSVLFRAGDAAQAFVLVLQGRIEVHLTAASGREILLYAVEPGQSCVQTTVGLLGDDPYSGEALATRDSDLVLIPKRQFLRLMDRDSRFRAFVLRAFGQRMADLTRVLEQVAFERVETRLAAALLDLAVDGVVRATQADLAARIGSAREVVSRQLHGLAQAGLIATIRGQVRLLDRAGLQRLAQCDHVTDAPETLR